MAFGWWIAAGWRGRRGARFTADGHICSGGVFRCIANLWLLLLLLLRLCRWWRGRRRVIELNRWGWRRGHWWWGNVVRGGRVGEGGSVLLSAAALDITWATELRGHKSPIFFFIHPHLLFILLILLIWEAHLDNILALPPSTLH